MSIHIFLVRLVALLWGLGKVVRPCSKNKTLARLRVGSCQLDPTRLIQRFDPIAGVELFTNNPITFLMDEFA